MTCEDFALIEKALDIVLPERYKKIALEAPLKDTAYSDAFYDDPQKVIRTNLRLRKNGIYGSEPLRKNHLVVGFCLGNYAYIDVSSDEDVHYLADRTKTWHYTPEDKTHNSMRITLQSYIDFKLLFHKSDMERANNPPQQQDRKVTTEQTYAFLAGMWEDHKKKQDAVKKDGKDQEISSN